jgi:hypothetical protein
MQLIHPSRRLGAAALVVTGFGVAAVTLAAFPTVAQGAVAAVTSVSCSVTGSNWCISGNNSSSGIGVIGTSESGTGLRGTSTSQYGLKATSVSGTAILAQTTTGQAGVYATGGSNGVYGTTANGKGEGVEGFVNGSGVGVYGYSNSGTAVQAIANSGGAVYARNNGTQTPTLSVENEAQGGAAAEFTGDTGVRVHDAYFDSSPFAAYDDSGHLVILMTNQGDIYYSGGLKSLAKTRGGATVTSFGANSTRPTVEDSGSATLAQGAAAVALDPTFAATIDAGSYRVFLTPGGDTHGLYVAAKTARGFFVRESQGGRSTVPFDYRILATAIGNTGQRMAVVPANMLARRVHGAPRAAIPALPLSPPALGQK